MSAFANKPFVLLGINSDPSREAARELVDDGTVTWRSWWNGPKGTDGPIADRWEVYSWPAFFIIDAQGVIRLVPDDYEGSPDQVAAHLERTIEKLIHEAERAQAPKGT